VWPRCGLGRTTRHVPPVNRLVVSFGANKGIGFAGMVFPSIPVMSDVRFDPMQTVAPSSVKDRCRVHWIESQQLEFAGNFRLEQPSREVSAGPRP
jgi:hypothetical protein